MKEEECVVD